MLGESAVSGRAGHCGSMEAWVGVGTAGISGGVGATG